METVACIYRSVEAGEIVNGDLDWRDSYANPFGNGTISGVEVCEALPESTGLANGTICQIAWSGGSGWYVDDYQIVDGKWEFQGNNAPWQMSVG